jgi:hypothetical protein
MQEDRVSTQVSHSISERAYHIWERMGRPEGQALEHWLRAEAELAKEPARKMAEADMPATASRRGRRKKA